MYDFSRVSERLMNTDFSDFLNNAEKFVRFIDSNEVIKEYIDSSGAPTIDINEEMSVMRQGNAIFDIGNDDNSEVANINCILHYIVEHKIGYRSMVYFAYAHGSKKYQDMIDGFNKRVSMALILHIEGYLTKIGYEMGLDQRSVNNNFYGAVNNLKMQQGSNNTMINTVCLPVDFGAIQSVIEEIMKSKDKFESTFGDNAEKFSNDLSELSEAVKKKDQSRVRRLLLSLKNIAEGATGSLIASGVVALLTDVL